MKSIYFMALLLTTQLAQANSEKKKGPMPHERTDTGKLANATAGRYIYLGDVPKFDGNELEITISKLNLTARVTAYVNQNRIDTYAQQLFMRWKTIRDASMDPVFSYHPLVKISTLAENQPKNTQAWAAVASQYSNHILENNGIDIYSKERNASNYSSNESEDRYKENIAEAYFRYLFDTKESSDSVINDNAKLERLLSNSNSARLFNKHLGHIYTRSNERPDYLGYLTLVYPIAATVAGPFNQPKEGVVDLKTAESIEARWWSNKWQDEFGGFPFLLIEWSGVAFHGPITNYGPLQVWFLRRGYVSHGCHRMDASDVMELRTLMPTNLAKAGGQIKVKILDYLDVVDWDQDGKEEVVDVKYYHVPTSIAVPKGKTIEDAVAPYSIENQQKAFILNNQFAKKYYDVASDTFSNVPRYVMNGKKLTRDGVHNNLSVKRFDYRPSRVIQYTEDGLKFTGFNDVLGKYPPRYFQKY